jgi:hypothetical protein
LINYRIYENGVASVPAVWTEAISTQKFTYTSGDLPQIAEFPDIDMSTK